MLIHSSPLTIVTDRLPLLAALAATVDVCTVQQQQQQQQQRRRPVQVRDRLI